MNVWIHPHNSILSVQNFTAITTEIDRSWNKNQISNMSKYQCPICFEHTCPEQVVITSCGHIFCKSCIEQSMTMNLNCPVCRSVIMDKIYPDCSLIAINTPSFLSDLSARIDSIVETLRNNQEHGTPKFTTVCHKMIVDKAVEYLQTDAADAVLCTFDGMVKMDSYTRFCKHKIFLNKFLSNSDLGIDKHSNFVGCTFKCVTFRGVLMNSLFVNCTFDDCFFSRCSFIGDKSAFVDCRFLHGTRFHDCDTEEPVSWNKVNMDQEIQFSRIMKIRGVHNVTFLCSEYSGRSNRSFI